MRASLSLDGIWQFHLDSADAGLTGGWFRPEATFDRELPVPLPWQVADPALRQYAGVAWYRRSFAVPADWRGQRIVVHFGAVDYEARVWVNGQEVGGHVGGYTPFDLDVTDAVRWDVQNVLTLRAYDPANLDEVPHGKQGGRWYTATSGPWQSVTLATHPAQRVRTIRCFPDAHRGAVQAAVDCALAPGTVGDLLVEVVDPVSGRAMGEARAVVTAGTPTARVEIGMSDATRWTPETPALYTLRTTLRAGSETLDVHGERFGLRSVEIRDGRILLNGEPFYMRGALDQAFWPDTLYTAPSDEEIEREIRLAKEMGLNLLRKHIKPEDPRYLDACDRLGMFIWAEPANPSVFTETAKQALRRDLFEMIERDFNRPSVIVWSLYNEDWGLPGLWSDHDQHAWLTDLYHEVKSIDPTRLVCDNSGWAHVLTDLNDYHEYFAAPERAVRFSEKLDFLLAHPEDNYAQGQAPTGAPILISEWGNWSMPNPRDARDRYDGADPPWFAYDRAYARAEGLPRARPENPLTERIKTVAGYEERFARLGLKSVFGSVDALTQHIQQRVFRALKIQVEEMRRRPAIQGHVVTEFSDIEWEVNGWLDYWRQPKAFHAGLADLNADIALIAVPDRPTAWSGETLTVEITVANTTRTPVRGQVRWWLADGEPSGQVMVEAGAFETRSYPAAIRFGVPDGAPRTTTLLLELHGEDGTMARTSADLAFAPRAAGLVGDVPLNGHSLDKTFRQRVERQGFRVPRSFTPDIPVAIATRLDATVWSWVQEGGRLVYLPAVAGDGLELTGLRVSSLSPGESWRMAAGVAWARADRLAPAPVRPDLGWEVAEIFPLQTFDAACLQDGDEQLAGYFEGWLANAGAIVVQRAVGRGRLLATTFRFEDAYGLDPVATLLLNRLVEVVNA